MCLFCVFPMTLGESKQSGDLLTRYVVDQRAYRPRLFQPITLPQLTGPDALICSGLVVDAAGHRPSVDGIDDTIFGKEPHLITPLLRLAVFTLGVIIVDEVLVPNVLIERRVQRSIREVLWERHVAFGEVDGS